MSSACMRAQDRKRWVSCILCYYTFWSLGFEFENAVHEELEDVELAAPHGFPVAPVHESSSRGCVQEGAHLGDAMISDTKGPSVERPREVCGRCTRTKSSRRREPRQSNGFLLTTETVETVEEAVRMLKLYSLRWRIEEWHRVLKSGCKVQEHQHVSAERLKRVIAMDAVLAWRIQLMTLLGREVSDLPCTVFLDEWEAKVLEATVEDRTKRKLERALTLAEAITAVARIGSYLARPSDSPPGSTVLWRGFITRNGMVIGYRLGMARDP